MKVFKMISILLAASVVSGCAAGGYGVSEYILNKDGTFNIKSGKEMASVEAVMTRGTDSQPDLIYFNAQGVKAFEGQKISAEVARDVTAAVKEVLPQVVNAAVKAALGTSLLDSAGTLLTPYGTPADPQ